MNEDDDDEEEDDDYGHDGDDVHQTCLRSRFRTLTPTYTSFTDACAFINL